MLNAFESVINGIDAIILFLTNTVQGLFMMIESIRPSFTMVGRMLGFIPAELAAFGTAAIAVVVCYLIIGR